MSKGTKVFLALFALFVCVLVLYYARTSRTPGDDRALNEAVQRPTDPTARPESARTGKTTTPEQSSTLLSRTFGNRQPPALNRTAQVPAIPQPTASRPPVETVTMGQPLPPGLVPARSAPPVTEQPTAVSARPSEVPSARSRQSRETYTVRAGDTLTSISLAWFGDANRWDLIVAANPGLDPQRLKVGQALAMPARAAGTTTPAATSNSDGTAERYTVRPGDTLSRIASRVYGDASDWRRIYAANRDRLSGPDGLDVGQVLRIPR